MPSMRSWLGAIYDQARASTERARVAHRVTRQTGLVENAHLGGIRVLARALGRTSPTTVIRYHAANTPHRTALVYGERTWSYHELNQHTDRVANALRRQGIGRGDAVVFMLHNVPEFLFLQGATSRIGASAVTVSWRSTPSELRYLLTNARARAIFFDASVADVVSRVLSETGIGDRAFSVAGAAPGFSSFEEILTDADASVPPDHSEDAAVVIYTSGTTGKPKGAVRKFGKEAAVQVLSFIGETPMHVGQTHLAVCPLYHSTAFGFITVSFIVGSTIVLLDGFEPESFLDALERHRVNHTAVVPTMLHRTLSMGKDAVKRRDLSNLRAIFTGGAPLSPALGEAVMDAYGDVLYNFYGATETGFVTLAKPSDLRAAPGTIGRCIRGNEIRLLDEAGRPVKQGEVGELYTKSGNLVAGYHDNPEATSESMREGFFSVGDLARQDESGYYFLEGRKRDMIISGGVNVYPREIETVLTAHPDVAEAAVIGVPDDEWGERVRAFVALKSDARVGLEELMAYCQTELAGPKRPREITILDELPRNPTGKVLKRQLREMAF
jgi:fatty-acyl-CoA synthase